MPTKISFSLSESSIQNAIKELQKYKSDLNSKCEEFCRRLTELGKIQAQSHVAESPLGKYITINCSISPESMGCKAMLYGIGADKVSRWQTQEGIQEATFNTLLMVEFGSGSYGMSNPKAKELGYGTGTFPGQTHAFDGHWYYMDLNGQWHTSSGIRPTMPMYRASESMILNIQKIAKEVFES